MESIFTRAAKFLKEQRRHKRWKHIVSVLAAVVVFCTTYALILPAMTAERQTYCGREEHVHSEECFDNGVQICGIEEHTHTNECYVLEENDQIIDEGPGIPAAQDPGMEGTGGLIGDVTVEEGSPSEDPEDGEDTVQLQIEDVEVEQDNEQTGTETKSQDQLSQALASFSLTGNLEADVLETAKAHLGCVENDRQFVNEVLRYAQVEGMPAVIDEAGNYTSYADLAREARSAGIYADISHIPAVGDVVFIDRDADQGKLDQEDDRIDHIGIVVNVRTAAVTSEATGATVETLKDIMILTDNTNGLIESFFYTMDDPTNVNMIAGYAVLPGRSTAGREPETEEPAPAETESETGAETEMAQETESELVTEAAAEGTPGEEATEAVTEGTPEELATEAATEEIPGEPATEAITEETPGELATEAITEGAPAEPATEGTPMEPATEALTESAPTEPATETVTEAAKEEETQPAELVTEPSETEAEKAAAATEPTTEALTEEPAGKPAKNAAPAEKETGIGIEVSAVEDKETETDTEMSANEDTETETGTEMSANDDMETETNEEMSSNDDIYTDTEETEDETDDWGWTWTDFEDETEMETEPEFSDPDTDLETSGDWEASVADVELSGLWADDLTAVAETQLGEKESSTNFITAEDGTRKGITRYGQWYGDPYGDWSVMFVSYCLNYAEVPRESMPRSGSCESLIEMLQVYDLYELPEEYEPAAGDLVFLDMDGDETADHAGIIDEITDTGIGGIKIIAGDVEDEVKSIAYAKKDAAILGYGRLPQRPSKRLHNKVFHDDNVIITAEYTDEARIPDAAILVASEVSPEDERYKQHFQTVQEMMDTESGQEPAAASYEGEADGSFEVVEGGNADAETEPETEKELYMRIYNIGFYVDETEVEPQAEVKISIEFLDDPGFAAGANTVIHMVDGGAPETLAVTTTDEEVDGRQTKKIEFETKTFSPYVFMAKNGSIL